MKIRLGCQEVSRLISAGHDERLAPADRARLRLHCMICARCRNVEEQLGFLRQAIRRLGREEPPPK